MFGRRAGRMIITITAATALLVGSVVGNQAVTNAAASPSPRIFGGAKTSTPSWFVHVVTKWKNGDWALCGGTLISPTWVITANHCVNPGRKLRLDKSYVQVSPPNGEDGPHIPIANVIRHDGFSFRSFNNDIALLQLQTEVANEPAAYGGSSSNPALGTNLEVWGFGATKRNRENASFKIRHVTVQVMATSPRCGKYGRSEVNFATMICAGVPAYNKDSCSGDSGGGLFTLASPRVQVGIVSWGEGCATRNFPGVYARIAAFSGWIESITGVAPAP